MRVAPGDGWRARTIKWVTTALALVAGMALSLTQWAAIGGKPIQDPDPRILKPFPKPSIAEGTSAQHSSMTPILRAERCPHPGRAAESRLKISPLAADTVAQGTTLQRSKGWLL